MESIPTISLKDYKNNKETISKEIYDACNKVGFFSIIDHDLDTDLVKKTLRLSKEFFNQTNDIKMKYYIEEGAGQRGYTPFGVETAKNALLPDQKEFWHHGRTSWEGNLEEKMPKNILIGEVNGINTALKKLYNDLEMLGRNILSFIAVSLELQDNWFDNKINQGNSILRLIHYPRLDQKNNGLRAEAHEDINLITLLLGTEQEGLEVLNKSNEWIPIKVSSEKIVCNVGDMLERLTNDKLKSTTHRVNNPKNSNADESRFSMPFFLHFNPDFFIETLPNCIEQKRPNKYKDGITADDFLKIRLEEINLT